MRTVPQAYCIATLLELAGLFYLFPDAVNPLGPAHLLAIVGDISFVIEIALPNYVRLEIEGVGNTVENVFDHQHALRSAESAEGSLRSLVSFADPALGVEHRDPVCVVAMEQGAPQNRFGEIKAPATVGPERQFKAAQMAL